MFTPDEIVAAARQQGLGKPKGRETPTMYRFVETGDTWVTVYASHVKLNLTPDEYQRVLMAIGASYEQQRALADHPGGADG